jgi:hypothetical protein
MRNALILAIPTSMLVAILLGPTVPAAGGVGEGGTSLLVYYLFAALFWGLVLQVAAFVRQKGLGEMTFIVAAVSVAMVLVIAATPAGALLFGLPGGVLAAAGHSPLWAYPGAVAIVFISLMSSIIGATMDEAEQAA